MRSAFVSLGRVIYYVLYPVFSVYLFRSRRVYAVIRVRDEVLLVKNWIDDGKWTLPGGGVDRGETPEDALVRELHEELKVDVLPGSLRLVSDWRLHKRKFWYRYYMVELQKKPQLIAQQFEIVDMRWVKDGELNEYMQQNELDGFARPLKRTLIHAP